MQNELRPGNLFDRDTLSFNQSTRNNYYSYISSTFPFWLIYIYLFISIFSLPHLIDKTFPSEDLLKDIIKHWQYNDPFEGPEKGRAICAQLMSCFKAADVGVTAKEIIKEDTCVINIVLPRRMRTNNAQKELHENVEMQEKLRALFADIKVREMESPVDKVSNSNSYPLLPLSDLIFLRSMHACMDVCICRRFPRWIWNNISMNPNY